MDTNELFGKEKISKVLLKLAPPVMLAQLIQALYNIVDSFFVGRASDSGLTALSMIYPIQLLMIAFAVGTGVGINTAMAAKLGTGGTKEADEYAGVGTPLAVVMWMLFAAVCYAIMHAYAKMSTDSPAVIDDVIAYGRIVCVFSCGLFLESVWTKILQAHGDMKTPMAAQPSCTRRWQAATPRLPAAPSTPTTWSPWSGCAARTAPYRQRTKQQNKGNLADRLNFDQSFYGNCRLSTICNYAILSK